jgi:hypothetical protein
MARNKILLRDVGHWEDAEVVVTDAVVRPGMLLEPTATGYRPHNTAGGVASYVFARAQHENQGNDVDDTIAVGDSFAALVCAPGCKINAYTSDTIAKGGWVESDGTGGVRAYGSGYRIGRAYAASDLSGTVGRVEIILGSTPL